MTLAILAVVFAILGLTPSLSSIPEAPLLAAAVLVQAAILVVTGRRAFIATKVPIAGPIAGALAGAIGGCAGGLAYIAFGKSGINVVVGLVAGTVEGSVLGLFGARSPGCESSRR